MLLQAAERAGDLPLHLWVHVHGLLLASMPRTEAGCFGKASAVLRQALQLAATCRLWRQAAIQATQALGLMVVPGSAVPPQYLSPLLGDLVTGCNLQLTGPILLATYLSRFLDLARPTGLSVTGADLCSKRAVVSLASATSVRVLVCLDELLPQHWPPDLESLTVGKAGA